MLLFTGDILQGVLLRTEWTVIGDGILACMSRDSEIFMSKHLAGQWLLNIYYKSILTKESRQEGGNVWVWQLGYFWEQYFCFG